MLGGTVDRLLRGGTAYSMDGVTHGAIALRGAEIVAVDADPRGLDSLVDSTTALVDTTGLTLLPSFADSHEHLLEAARNTALVPVGSARSIRELTDMISAAAVNARPGAWVMTSMAWNEANLAEGRLPTLDELDAASPEHPVLARRGGHLAIANSLALQSAGITADSTNPAGGSLGHDGGGRLNGVVEGAAVYTVLAKAPPVPTEDLARGLRQASGEYARHGVGLIREALVQVSELAAYQTALERADLSVRVRLMIRLDQDKSEADSIALMEGLGFRSGFGDDWLRIWGFKAVLDGGVVGASVEDPYANDPSSRGHLNWDLELLQRVLTAAVRRGWRIGTHAVGDHAVGVILDVYEKVLADGDVRPGSLVIEHGLLATEQQRARAARMGLPVTVQHPLLWNMGKEMVATWGPERAARANPIDGWLALGVPVAAGTDIVRPFNPMTNVWGMVTRQTRDAGVLGPEHAIDVRTAIELYTAGTARLCGEERRWGRLIPGHLADIVAYDADPFTLPVNDLEQLFPAFTLVGGRPVFDSRGLFA